MATRKRKKKAEEIDMVEKTDIEEPKTAPKKKIKKRVRTPRNDISSPSKGLINFKAWFVNLMAKDRRLKEYHYEQLKLYMGGLGLTETEEVSKYEQALKGYFGG